MAKAKQVKVVDRPMSQNTDVYNIFICTCETVDRANDLAKLLNGDDFRIAVKADSNQLFLASNRAPHLVRRVKKFAKQWNKLVNYIWA